MVFNAWLLGPTGHRRCWGVWAAPAAGRSTQAYAWRRFEVDLHDGVADHDPTVFTLCYEIVLPGRESAFRAGFGPHCYRENTEIGAPTGLLSR